MDLQQEESFRRMMRLVLNEWVAATVQLHFGKATPENDDKFNAFVQVRQDLTLPFFAAKRKVPILL